MGQLLANLNDPVIYENDKRFLLKYKTKGEEILSKIQKLTEELQQTTNEKERIKKQMQINKQLENLSQLERDFKRYREETSSKRIQLYTQWKDKLAGAVDGIRGIISSDNQLNSALRLKKQDKH